MKKYLRITILIAACVLPVSPYTVIPVFAAERAVAKENLEKLIKTKSCKGCDLSGLILNRLDLVDADLEGADLSATKLSLTNLTRANLKNTNLRGAVFGGTDLSDADLRGADLRGTSLDSSYYQGARFDGEFIPSRSVADVGEPEVEKEIFVADSVKPKQLPETRDAEIGEKPEPQLPSPTIAAVQKQKLEPVSEKITSVEKDSQIPASVSLVSPPAAKRIAPVQQAIVDVSGQDENNSSDRVAVPLEPAVSVPIKKTGATVPEKKNTSDVDAAPLQPSMKTETKNKPLFIPVAAASASIKKDDKHDPVVPTKSAAPTELPAKAVKERKDVQQAAAARGTQPEKKTEEKSTASRGVPPISEKPVAGKTKEDNLARLLDKNRCYGCDLSGLDLSGKNLDSADLEKANLTGCNLENTDLDKANLKGALLVKTNLRKASLKKADFYKADLTGADLTGAMVEGAMFDNAETTAAVGLKEAIGVTGK